MNYFGLLTGIATLFIIGLGFPLVIQGERRFGYLWWPYRMTIGSVFIIISFFIRIDWLSVGITVLGATFVWGSTEMKERLSVLKLAGIRLIRTRSNRHLKTSSKNGEHRIYDWFIGNGVRRTE